MKQKCSITKTQYKQNGYWQDHLTFLISTGWCSHFLCSSFPYLDWVTFPSPWTHSYAVANTHESIKCVAVKSLWQSRVWLVSVQTSCSGKLISLREDFCFFLSFLCQPLNTINVTFNFVSVTYSSCVNAVKFGNVNVINKLFTVIHSVNNLNKICDITITCLVYKTPHLQCVQMLN